MDNPIAAAYMGMRLACIEIARKNRTRFNGKGVCFECGKLVDVNDPCFKITGICFDCDDKCSQEDCINCDQFVDDNCSRVYI